jgi:hypothetical protein
MNTMTALSAAVLIAAAPAVLAQNVSSKAPNQRHHVSKKHPRVVSGYAPLYATHPNGWNNSGYPRAFGYVPTEPKDWALEGSRQAGGGGGGGSGGGSGM